MRFALIVKFFIFIEIHGDVSMARCIRKKDLIINIWVVAYLLFKHYYNVRCSDVGRAWSNFLLVNSTIIY